MTRTIGGTLDYAVLARLNRPRTSDAMREAISDMAARGLGVHEIAVACEMSVEQVKRIVAEQQRHGARGGA